MKTVTRAEIKVITGKDHSVHDDSSPSAGPHHKGVRPPAAQVPRVHVHHGCGKGFAALRKFTWRLRRYKGKIKYVCIDMSNAYSSRVEAVLPKAQIVYDHFHLLMQRYTTLGGDAGRAGGGARMPG